MAKAYLKNEDINKVEIELSSDVKKGDVVTFGEKSVIAGVDGKSGDVIICYAKGVFEIEAKSDEEFSYGDKLYFDKKDKIATKKADGNTYLGLSYCKKAKDETIAKVAIGEL